MIDCRGVTRNGPRVTRHRFAVHLEGALLELMGWIDRCGNSGSEVGLRIEDEIERCLGAGREQAHVHLQRLLRARDLYRYMTEEPSLAALKQSVYEMLLFHRTPEERWAAIRPLLLEGQELFNGVAWPGATAALEGCKQAISDRGGALGKLLALVALFNLEMNGESPPTNLLLHFRRGAFPLHTWEVCGSGGHKGNYLAPAHWTPAHPLCRWEYLGADLFHTLLREQGFASERLRPVNAPRPAPGQTPPPSHSTLPAQEQAVFCRMEPSGDGEAPRQMELLPFDPAVFLSELLRLVHRREGHEGVRLLALLLGACAGNRPELEQGVDVAELAARASLSDLSSRSLRTRCKRLHRIIALLAGVELTRGAAPSSGASGPPDHPDPAVVSSRLLTVVRFTAAPAGKARDEPLPERLHVLLDPVFYQYGLGEAFGEIPDAVLVAGAKEHPMLLHLFLLLRRWWEGTDPQASGAVERTASQLMIEAGIWVSPTGRYRALEALKRDLTTLQERGVLGGWRLQRSEIRDGMEDRYWLNPPRPAKQGALAGVG